MAKEKKCSECGGTVKLIECICGNVICKDCFDVRKFTPKKFRK